MVFKNNSHVVVIPLCIAMYVCGYILEMDKQVIFGGFKFSVQTSLKVLQLRTVNSLSYHCIPFVNQIVFAIYNLPPILSVTFRILKMKGGCFRKFGEGQLLPSLVGLVL